MYEEFEQQTQSEKSEEERKQIQEFGSVRTKSPRGNIHCLNIIGQVEGHILLPPQNKTTKYEHVLPQLVAVEEDPEIDYKLNLTLNKAQKREVNVAINNVFGFGGHNACMVFKKVK